MPIKPTDNVTTPTSLFSPVSTTVHALFLGIYAYIPSPLDWI